MRHQADAQRLLKSFPARNVREVKALDATLITMIEPVPSVSAAIRK
jgi:hypothetical protein